MSQCVPSWELEDNHHVPPPPPPPHHHHHHHHHRQTLRSHSDSSSLAPDVPTLDYEVAELTWENGQLAMHGLGPPRLQNKSLAAASTAKYNTWEKQPPAGGTLESIVNQATTIIPHRKSAPQSGCRDGGDDLVPWFEDHRRAVNAPAATSLTLTMDAMVPCSKSRNDHPEPSTHVHVPGVSTCVGGCSSTRAGSCSGAPEDARLPRVSVAAAAAGTAQEWSSRADQSVSGSATCGRDSRQVTLDTCDREFGTAGYTSTSFGSPENTSSAKQTVDDHDSPCQSRYEREAGIQEDKKKGNGKSSVSTKRSRAAAIHNQSERKRRDKINQRMKTLQKLVPNSSKTDKASMLDEVIEYLKQLQAQVNIMSRMNMSPMMLPLALQQQLQMSMIAPMGIGMNMGMGMGVMDLSSIGRANMTGIPPVLHPAAYMPAASAWDGLGDRLAGPSASAMPDPLAAFLACQSQPMTMDAYSRMATLYQQFQPPPGPVSKNKVI